MSVEPADAVTFSDLSATRGLSPTGPAAGNPSRCAGFLPDGGRPGGGAGREPGDRVPDVAALARSESGARAVESALTEVFPSARHLSAAERTEFAAELIAALCDAAELTIDQNAHEAIAGWRATARIKADKRQYAQALAPTEGGFGPAGVIA